MATKARFGGSALLVAAVLCWAVSVPGAPTTAEGNDNQSLTAAQILAETATTYRESASYTDIGTVTEEYLAPSAFTTVLEFETAMARQGPFRFKSLDESQNVLIVWSDGRQTLRWSSARPTIEELESLSAGLAELSGASGGAAQTIPKLLLQDEAVGSFVTDLRAPVRLEDDVLSGADCYRIRGREGTRSTILWIEKGRFVIRKIEQEYEVGHMHAITTTVYDPIINPDLSATELAFDPPTAGVTR